MKPAAYAVINLDAVQHNLAVVREHVPKAKIMAVVKANAYGHGLLRIASVLNNVDAFAVARVDEGVRLRAAGIEQPIAVLEGFTCAEELEDLVQYRLDAVIHSPQQVVIFEQSSAQDPISIWLKVDTGMNRLGFSTDEFVEIYQRLMACSIVKKPIHLMTHLAKADEKNDAMTATQIGRFTEIMAGFSNPRSIANSAGILGWPTAAAEWVRPGIMLYGISPFPESTGVQLGLRPVMGLHSRLIAVKPIRKGETVGYGGSWQCQQSTTMGVAAIGYGDGYPRQAKPGTPVLVNGRRAPLIGRVSMDMITVDLAGQPDAQPGDPVTLWGQGLAVEEVALYADTIPYTLVCGITQRVHIVEG